MNRFYSISIKNESWSEVDDENIWFYPTKTDYKYVISMEELHYFLFWISKSKYINEYFKNIKFEFDLTDNGLYFGYFKTELDPDNYSKSMYNKYQKYNFHNKKIIISTLINTLECDYILKYYKNNNLNLYFPLHVDLVSNLKEIFDEILYESMFYEVFMYCPSIAGYLKKHDDHIVARKLDQKRYKHEKRRFHSNLGNKRGSKFDMEWKEYCKRRDDYTCQCCGSKRNIEVHHINGYHRYPSLRTAGFNGVVLCEKCHKIYHSEYGRYATQNDFNDFMIIFRIRTCKYYNEDIIL